MNLEQSRPINVDYEHTQAEIIEIIEPDRVYEYSQLVSHITRTVWMRSIFSTSGKTERAVNLCPFVGVDLNLWPTVYMAVIVLPSRMWNESNQTKRSACMCGVEYGLDLCDLGHSGLDLHHEFHYLDLNYEKQLEVNRRIRCERSCVDSNLMIFQLSVLRWQGINHASSMMMGIVEWLLCRSFYAYFQITI